MPLHNTFTLRLGFQRMSRLQLQKCKCTHVCRLFVHLVLVIPPNIPQNHAAGCTRGSAVAAARASVKHWMKPEPPRCKQPYLLFLVEVEMFKPDRHMKRSVRVNSRLTDTRRGESGALPRSCWRPHPPQSARSAHIIYVEPILYTEQTLRHP